MTDVTLSKMGIFRRIVAVLGVCAAVALALRAQTPFFWAFASWPVSGGICLLAAGILFGLVVPRRRQESTQERSLGPYFTVSTARLCVALALWLASVILYARRGEGWVVYLGWPLSLVALLSASWTSPPLRAPLGAADLAPLILIFPTALAMRMWHLTTLPPLIVGDTLWEAEQARAILSGAQQQLIGFGWADIPLPGFVPDVLSMTLFGDNLFGMCMSAVLVGMASLVATYLLALELFGPRVGWLATGLLAISYTHFNFSRVPPHMHPLPCVLFSLYFVARATRTGRSWDAVLGGIFAGASFQMYYSGRGVVALVGLMAAHQLATRRFVLRQWLLTALGFSVALGPMAIYMARHWGPLMERTRAVWIVGPGHAGGFPWATFLDHSKVSFLTFWYTGNAEGERGLGRAMFDWFTGTLLVFGFGYALLRLGQLRNWLLVSGLVMIVVLGGALTLNPPFWQRMTALLPIGAILAAVALEECARLVPLPSSMLATILFAMLSVVGYRNWTYFVHHESIRDAPYSALTRYACNLSDARDIELVGMPWFPVIEGFVRVLAPRHRVREISLADALAERWPSFRTTALIVFMLPDRARLLPGLRATWPQGSVREVLLADGTPVLATYEANVTQ